MTVVFSHPLGGGVELAILEPWHADQFHATIDQHRVYLTAEIYAARVVLNPNDARRYLQGWADAHAAGTRHLVGIWLDGTLVGCVQLFDVDVSMGTAEMGVWLVPTAQGRGLMTRSCRYVLDWALRVRGLSRVQWAATPGNDRSIAVARRLGMTREGVLRSAWQVGGVRRDSEIWSMLAEEWPTRSHDWGPLPT
jgi:ribosomal-protein-serine acetyltransferase